MLLFTGCRCQLFESSFVCASCDRHWEQHETFFDTEDSRKKSGLPYGKTAEQSLNIIPFVMVTLTMTSGLI